MELVNTQLGRLDSYLLVLDNADDPSQVDDLIRTANGHLVITSRSRDWGLLSPSIITVNVPDKEEAVEMFETHSGRVRTVEVEQLVVEVGQRISTRKLLACWLMSLACAVDVALQRKSGS